MEWGHDEVQISRRETTEESNHRHRLLLRARQQRPRRRRAAEQREELAPSQVEHGLPSGTRCASLAHAQDAPEAPSRSLG
jgi:hypothetical protein